jgi:hypothetical protein
MPRNGNLNFTAHVEGVTTIGKRTGVRETFGHDLFEGAITLERAAVRLSPGDLCQSPHPNPLPEVEGI